jgi:hypothetical protein
MITGLLILGIALSIVGTILFSAYLIVCYCQGSEDVNEDVNYKILFPESRDYHFGLPKVFYDLGAGKFAPLANLKARREKRRRDITNGRAKLDALRRSNPDL